MKNKRCFTRWFIASIAFLSASAVQSDLSAQTTEQFFKGKSIAVSIGYSPGGTYDAIARLLSRHMGRHIPGQPVMVPQSMPGSGSIKAILHTYHVAPRDGTGLAVVARSYPIDPIFTEISFDTTGGEKYDPLKLNAIGSTGSEVSVGVVWNTSPIQTFDDLLKPGASLTVGATGSTDETARFPLLVNNLTGSKIKIVTGYPGGNDVTLAMEKGEVDGRWGWSWGSLKSRSKTWLDEKKIRVIFQMAIQKAVDLPDTPFIMDYVKTETDHQAVELLLSPNSYFAWPLIAPPEVPKDRLAALRRAFDQTMQDERFLAEAAKLALDIAPVSGEKMQEIIQRILSFDPATIERAKFLVK